MKIIILSITQYKEKDGIVDAISEEGPISFQVKGLFGSKGKFASLNNAMTIADIELSQGKSKYPTLKAFELIQTPMKEVTELNYMGALMFLSEITRKGLQDDEKAMLFKHLYAALLQLKTGNNPWWIVLVYTANILKATGAEFEVDHCMICGKRKGITTFSFEEGGFICKDCFQPDMERPFNTNQMLLIRAAFRAVDYAHVDENCTQENALAVLTRLREYINDYLGISIESLKFLSN